MESLTKICLDNICFNLPLNYKRCKSLSLKIRDLILQNIFEYSFFVIAKFTENGLNFFRKEIINLKFLDLSKNQFRKIKNYDFLNGHKLDKLIIGKSDEFQITTSNFELTVKNLHYPGGLDDYVNNLNELFKLLKLTDSFKMEGICRYTDENLPKKFLSTKFGDKITSLNLYKCVLKIHQYKEIMNIIKDKKNLREIQLNLPDFHEEGENFQNYGDYIKLIPNCIKKVYV